MLSCCAAPGRAQTDNFLAVGGQATVRDPSEARAHGTHDIGLMWRFGHGSNGWGWQWGLNWFSLDLGQRAGLDIIDIGELRVKPVTIGYGYTYAIRGISVEGNLLGGYALTSLHLASTGADGLSAMTGTRVTAAAVDNTLVARPELIVWFDLTRRVGIAMNAGYMFARPVLTLTTPEGSQTRRVNADLFSIKLGFVYRLF